MVLIDTCDAPASAQVRKPSARSSALPFQDTWPCMPIWAGSRPASLAASVTSCRARSSFGPGPPMGKPPSPRRQWRQAGSGHLVIGAVVCDGLLGPQLAHQLHLLVAALTAGRKVFSQCLIL